MFGDLVYTWMAFRLARKEGRSDVTAMPLGLDAPSTIGMAFTVLGPAFLAAKTRMPEHEAAIVGLAGRHGLHDPDRPLQGGHVVRGRRHPARRCPGRACSARWPAIGIALMGVLQLGDILAEPVVGMISLGLIFYALIARLRLPFDAPGRAGLGGGGRGGLLPAGRAGPAAAPAAAADPRASPSACPCRPSASWTGCRSRSTQYLPMAIPFAILTVVGGINVTESARLAGDDYKTRDILLTEAVATLIAGVCGGVSQSTPYIGHPAYKAMGGRAAYTLACALFVGPGRDARLHPAHGQDPAPGLPGSHPDLRRLRHRGAVLPRDAPRATRPRCASRSSRPSPSSCASPSTRRTPSCSSSALEPRAWWRRRRRSRSRFADNFGVFVMLAHGFILTAMLWGAFLAFLIDHRFARLRGDAGHLLGPLAVRRHPLRPADRRHLPALERGPARVGRAVPLGRRLCPGRAS